MPVCAYCKQQIKDGQRGYKYLEVPLPFGRFVNGELVLLKIGDCIHADRKDCHILS